MKKDDYFVELRETMKKNPLVLVGVCDIEGVEICKFLKKERIEYIEIKLSKESPFFDEISEEIKERVKKALESNQKVVSFCIKGNLPDGVLNISSYWYGGNISEDRPLSPIEQLSFALKKEINPYYKLISVNGRGAIYAMREEAEAILKGFGAKSRYKEILKMAGITDYELEDYRQKFYDSLEAGMEKIPEVYRAGIGLVIKEIRRRDRKAEGITMEEESQAERAVMKSYLIGSVTIVELHDARPAAVFDRLVETEKYGLLMLSATGESSFMGPWKKVKQFEEHFPNGRIFGQPPKRGYWVGKYSKLLILDFVESMEKVKEKKDMEKERENSLFMKL